MFNFINKRISLFDFDKYKSFDKNVKYVFESNFIPISLAYEYQYETNVISDIYTYDGNILVADINQLKAIDTYLTNDNLSILKNYAIMRILTEYSQYINDDFYKINNDFEEDINGIAEEFESEDELIYHLCLLLSISI